MQIEKINRTVEALRRGLDEAQDGIGGDPSFASIKISVRFRDERGAGYDVALDDSGNVTVQPQRAPQKKEGQV